MELAFLGCGGGRVVTDRQTLATGGFRVHVDRFKMHVDPGPGALVKTFENGLDPVGLDAVFVSHAHVDHSNDAGVLIESLNFNAFKKKRGLLVSAPTVISGGNGFEKQVDDYFQKMLQKIIPLNWGQRETLTPQGVLAYTADTAYFKGFEKPLEGSDHIVFNCLRPDADRFPFHLCADDVIGTLNNCKRKPLTAILSHAGLKMIEAGREKQRLRIEKATGVRTICAEEGLVLNLGKSKKP